MMTELESLQALLAENLPPPTRGKVRDNYLLTSTYLSRSFRLSVPSLRWSAFDFKMGFPNPGQDEMLNAFDVAAKLLVRKKVGLIDTDLVAYGVNIDNFLPASLRGNKLLQRIAPVTEIVDLYPIECVGRNNSTGTFHKAYVAAKGGPVWGHEGIPAGQPEGFAFAKAIYTPTTKAPPGHHDEPHDVDWANNIFGYEPEETTLALLAMFTTHSAKGGVMGVDTKFELGRRKVSKAARAINPRERGRLVVADEVWTPHSSRFWKKSEYDVCFPERLPDAMDKQIGRAWAISEGVDTLDPKNPEHRERVFAMRAPSDVLENMRSRTFEAFEMMHGMSIPQFQRDVLGVAD